MVVEFSFKQGSSVSVYYVEFVSSPNLADLVLSPGLIFDTVNKIRTLTGCDGYFLGMRDVDLDDSVIKRKRSKVFLID